MAPRQAEFEVLFGVKKGAEVVVGESGNFLAGDGEEAGDIMKLNAFTLLGPEPGMTSCSYILVPARRSVAEA